jgi:hypothetical protein
LLKKSLKNLAQAASAVSAPEALPVKARVQLSAVVVLTIAEGFSAGS